jgi:hypothetical protein
MNNYTMFITSPLAFLSVYFIQVAKIDNNDSLPFKIKKLA